MSDVLNVPCPGCGADNELTFEYVSENESFVCKSCGNTVRIEKSESFEHIDDAVESAFNDFIKNGQKSLDKMLKF